MSESHQTFTGSVASEWSVRPKKGDPRPPFDILVVDVSSYTALEISGRLRLSFFNGRLKSTQFFPSDLQLFKQRLAEKTGLNLDGPHKSLPPRTSLWFATTVDGKDFVEFTDDYLEKEMNCWLDKHGYEETQILGALGLFAGALRPSGNRISGWSSVRHVWKLKGIAFN